MNAIELLKTDHERVNDLFTRLDEAIEIREKRAIFGELRNELEIHSYIEETVFYPVFSEKEGFVDLIEEAYDEHQEIKDMLGEIEAAGSDEDFEDMIDELHECVQGHVEEEESELFPKVTGAVSAEELNRLGDQLQAARRKAPAAAA